MVEARKQNVFWLGGSLGGACWKNMCASGEERVWLRRRIGVTRKKNYRGSEEQLVWFEGIVFFICSSDQGPIR